jgi:L-methionine (R)-S-oxide reductase
MVPPWVAIDQIVVVLMGDDRTRMEKAKAVAELIRSAGAYRWVGLYDVGDQQISAIAWTGSVAPAFATFPLSKGLSGDAVRTRAPVIVEDVSTDPRYVTTFPSTKSELIVPVLVGETVPGTIEVESERVNAFSSQDVRFLQDCARAARQLWSLHGTAGPH